MREKQEDKEKIVIINKCVKTLVGAPQKSSSNKVEQKAEQRMQLKNKDVLVCEVLA